MSEEIVLASSAASSADVSQRKNMSLVENIDPTDVMISTDPTKGFIMYRSRPRETFSITTEDMFLQWPKITGEGNLGHSFKYLGKAINPAEDDRAKAEFELPLTVGGRDMDAVTAERTDLVPKQIATLKAVYDTAVNVLTYAFNNPAAKPGMDLHVNKALEAAYNAELDFDARNAELAGTAPKYASTDDIKLAADADPALAARLRAAQLKAFIASATKPENPALYDEEGVEKRTRTMPADKKMKTLQLKLTRKVYKYTGKYSESNPPPPAFVPGFVLTRDNWPELLAALDKVDAKEKYVYNPFTYIDARTDKEIPHHTYVPVGRTTAVIDPFYSPLKNRVALVKIQLFFQVYATPKAYGAKVIPASKLYIIRYAARSGQSEPVPIDHSFAMPFEDVVDDDDTPKAIEPPKRLAIKNEVD